MCLTAWQVRKCTEWILIFQKYLKLPGEKGGLVPSLVENHRSPNYLLFLHHYNNNLYLLCLLCVTHSKSTFLYINQSSCYDYYWYFTDKEEKHRQFKWSILPQEEQVGTLRFFLSGSHGMRWADGHWGSPHGEAGGQVYLHRLVGRHSEVALLAE